jgi:GT2 family glycosyltransferase
VTFSVFVSIVTYNSARYIQRCYESVVQQKRFGLGENLFVSIIDNGSTDETKDIVQALSPAPSIIESLPVNLGFAGGHNRAVTLFFESPSDFFLTLNPDVILPLEFLQSLCARILSYPSAGIFTPKLLRADDELYPLIPPRLDAAGMYFTYSLRHLDRGDGEISEGRFQVEQPVSGGTGACLCLRRSCVEDLLLTGTREPDVDRVYPQLSQEREKRRFLFDEAFFAYREDADLMWRAAKLGWRCIYLPTVVALHRRTVVPERRTSLPPVLNLNSVRNRFLLQLNNYSFLHDWKALLPGLIVRNLLVIVGVCFRERSSLPAFGQIFSLWKRALERRRILGRRAIGRRSLSVFARR